MKTNLIAAALTLLAPTAALAICPPTAEPRLTALSIDGTSDYLDAATLDTIRQDGLATCPATVEGLTAVAEAINAAYDAAGARLAFARPVTLDGTRGGIELVEIVYGAVTVAPTEDTDPDYILRRARIAQGDLADLDVLQERLAVFPETDDIRVTAELDPGAEEGTTDLTLTVEEPPRWQRRVTLTNDGSPEVGEWRLGVSAMRSSLTGIRDPLSFGARVGEGATSLDIAYARPIADDGSRVALSLALAENRFVNAAPPVDDLVNETATLAFGLTKPLWAGDAGNDTLEGGLTLTRERSDILGVAITEQDLAELTMGSSHVRRTPGVSVSALSHRAGLARLDDGVANADDTIARWSGTALHARVLDEAWSLTAQLDWQVSSGPVAAAQRFSVAGASAVRGFPSSESGSDAGFALRLEATRTFEVEGALDLSGFVFADAGRSWNRVTGAGAVANDPLYAAGAGVIVGVPLGEGDARLDLRLTAAVPLRDTRTFDDAGEVELLFDAGIGF